MSEFHVYLHLVTEPSEGVTGRLESILTRLTHFEDSMNAKVQQVVDDLAANRDKVRLLTNIVLAIRTKLQGDSAVIAQLRIDLAAAILALQNAGIPPAELQALQDVHDGLAAATAEVDADVAAVVADITANTEVPPAP
jgi:hypothetical protein